MPNNLQVFFGQLCKASSDLLLTAMAYRALAENVLLVRRPRSVITDFPKLTGFSIVIPSLILASVNAKNLWDEHWEHWEHLPPLEDRVEYPYMNIRTKAYPWGNGDEVSLSELIRLFRSLLIIVVYRHFCKSCFVCLRG